MRTVKATPSRTPTTLDLDLDRPRPKPAAARPAAPPPAPPGEPEQVVLRRRVVCYWRACPHPATVRFRFVAPSLLASEPPRDYCPGHGEAMTGQVGAVLAARLRVLG